MKSVDDMPPSVMDMLQMFLAASSRGEHVSLVLESRAKTLTYKYQCVEQLAGAPAPTNTHTKKNPARLRRSRLRQEEFFRKKHGDATNSGSQKSADPMPNKAAGSQQLLVQLKSQQTGQVADGLPQLGKTKEEETAEVIPQLDGVGGGIGQQEDDKVKVIYYFKSEYAEESILEALAEIFPDKNVVSSAVLVSRTRTDPCSNVHNCVVEVEVPVGDEQHFCWPDLKPVDADLFKDIKKINK